MSRSTIREIVHKYYTAWAEQRRPVAKSLLADDLDFRSPQDKFSNSGDFLEACWNYSSGLAGVDFLKEIYENDQGFVILDWRNEDGSRFLDAEYVRVEAGKIQEILVVNNSPLFSSFYS